MAQEEEAPASVSGSQGVQAGSGNVQINRWESKAPVDPVSLSALSPHVAVSRLQQMPHDDIVDLFARASPGDVADVLAAFLERDEDGLVAVLGDINRRKATELIRSFAPTNWWLAKLPEAAEAIDRRAAGLKWGHAGTLEFVGARMGRRNLEAGYVRKYKNGSVCWSEGYGIQAVGGVIEDYYAANRGRLWIPSGGLEAVPSSPLGTSGIRQPFYGSTVYSSKHGVYTVSAILQLGREGVSGGWLGFPVGEALANFDLNLVQCFEGGAIYLYHSDVFPVRLEVVEALSGRTKFRPVSKEGTTESSSGESGRVQRFQVNLEEGGQETAVYSSAGRGVVVVAPEVWSYYRNLGAENSWLGFPLPQRMRRRRRRRASEPVRTPDLWPRPDPVQTQDPVRTPVPVVQAFDGGSIYWRPETDPIAVRAPVLETILQALGWGDDLGWPVSEEKPIGGDDAERIQFFENGNVTLRDGKREIWVRPGTREGSRL